MINSSHAIWKFANTAGELDDWLPYAEDLIQEWSKSSIEKVKFKSTFEIILATLLLEDNLLPSPAIHALSNIVLDTIGEATVKKMQLDALQIKPPKPGRKKDYTEKFIRCSEVRMLIEKGESISSAYRKVADKYCKSPDTIRRDYERISKKSRK